MPNKKIKILTKGCEEIIGEVIIHHEFYSYNLKNERDIIVWLPPGYHMSNKHYPVIYMHDGQNLFNPKTSFTGYDWRVDEILTLLLERQMIEEVIVVGIYNTNDRLDEYNYFNEKGKRYARFLIKELKEFIDENYRTKSDYINTAIIGSSMGGLISFQLAWYFPGIFGKAACISNSFWVNDKKILSHVEKDQREHFHQKIYLDCSTSEKELINDNKKMCVLLRKSGLKQNENLLCYFPKDGKHTEEDWSKRLHIPLIFLFGIEFIKGKNNG